MHTIDDFQDMRWAIRRELLGETRQRHTLWTSNHQHNFNAIYLLELDEHKNRPATSWTVFYKAG